MKLSNSAEAAASLMALQECGLLSGHEIGIVNRLGEPDSPLDQAVALAETIHLHIKVDDTRQLPINQFFDAGARLDHQKDGFVKYRFPGSVNAIFSHIKVSQDELLETETNRRPRPFLDHIGVDLRDETEPVRQTFDALPAVAGTLKWAHASQGGVDRPVYCCHVEVAEKHWLYPPDEAEHTGIPLEFAYGALKVNPDKMGCDLRPGNPEKVAVNSLAATQSGLPVGSRPFNNTSLPAGARFANDVISQQFNGQATYHSLQTRLERRLSGGTSFLASYTWSKSIDNVSGIGTGADDLAQDSYNLAAQRGVSNFDVPHKFVFSSTWALPFGRNRSLLKDASPVVSALLSDWQINGILTYQSGQPFTVTVGAFDAGTGISNRRPNQVSDPHENVPDGFAFNPAAFVAPPAGQFESVGRNTLRADNYFNTDFAVLRNFRFSPLGEAGAIEFRAELFNLFNNPSFTLPVSSLSNAAFGRYVSNSTAPRVIQFVAKVRF